MKRTNMTAEIIIDDRLDPSHIIRSRTDRRKNNDGPMPEFANISYDGDNSSFKVPSDMLNLFFKERINYRRPSDHTHIKSRKVSVG